MIIGIDGNEANIINRVGVNKYAFKLLCELHKLNEEKQNPNKLIVYLKNKPLSDLPNETNNFKYKVLGGSGFWVVTKLMPHLFLNPEKLDILFSPSHYTVPFSTIPRVCSIMDLGYLEFPGQFSKKVLWQLKYWTAISILSSKQVLTISEATKKDIVRHYPSASKKTNVVYISHDVEDSDFNITDKDVRRVKNKYSIVSDYILYLGTLKPSKNIDGLIEAFSIISSTSGFEKLQLVIAGKRGWMYEDLFNKVEKLGLKDKVIFTDYLPEEEKMPLRRGALVFAQPSFWEGFGIDTLSAMVAGIPVVVSNAGSLPEVVGKSGIVVDPYDVNSITDGLLKVLKMDKKEYNRYVSLGLEQVKKFSWENCAKETLEILENATR